MHRNTYIESPKLLDEQLTLKNNPRIHFAGQITGVEGYVESAAMGQWAGLCAVAKIRDSKMTLPPRESAFGSLLEYLTKGPLHGNFAPMNINFGLLPPSKERIKKKALRRKWILGQGRESFDGWRKKASEEFHHREFGLPRIEPEVPYTL